MQEKIQNESLNNSQDFEISLMEIWLIVLKRKWIIVGCLFLTLLTTGIYLLITKPIFESRAMMQIGKIGYGDSEQKLTSIPIEDRLSLIQRINNESGFPFPYSIQADKQTDPVFYKQINSAIIITAQGETAIKAQQNLTTITDALIKKHQQIFDSIRSLQQKRLDSLQKELKTVDIEIELLKQKMQNNGRSEEFKSIFTFQRTSLDELYSKLEQQIISQEMIMSELYTKPTQLLLPPTLNNCPIAPKKKMYILLASFAGLCMGLFAAFIIEFFINLRAKSSQQNQA